MSDTTASLRRKIANAGDLQSVVRTMKAVAASSIGQYEQSVRALADYYRTVELGLGACFRAGEAAGPMTPDGGAQHREPLIGAIVFGSDQGLVGQFNELVVDLAVKTLAGMPGKRRVWAVGERVHARLADAGLPLMALFSLPSAVEAVAPLVGRILVESEEAHDGLEVTELHLFYNHPTSGAVYAPTSKRLLPLDEDWRKKLAAGPWPTGALPEVLGDARATLRAFLRGYVFISLFRACAESLASENASRLAAMQRADKNIDDLLVELNGKFHRLRQSGIDEELFDVISGSSKRSEAAATHEINTHDFRVPSGKKVHLDKWPTLTKPVYESKKEYEALLQEQVKALSELQRVHYAANTYSVLLIFQAMDAAGKDGAIRHVMSGVNPQGCQVFSFKHPSATELEHDFLWRTTRSLPERGRIGIFNRSYYEEVLIVRVHPEILRTEGLPDERALSAKTIWEGRYRSIVDLEAHLHRNGTRIIKIFLHLSKEEQRKRFLDRIDDPDKNWKLSVADVEERKFWKRYMKAYEECLSATSTDDAPWYVVPADDKKSSRLIISEIVLDLFKGLKLAYPKPTAKHRKELRLIRERLEK